MPCNGTTLLQNDYIVAQQAQSSTKQHKYLLFKLQKYLYQLTILSRLRNLEKEIVKQTEHMGIAIDIEKDYLYKQGIEKGIEKEKENAKMKELLTAKKLKQSGVAIDIIAKSFGLTIEEVKKL